MRFHILPGLLAVLLLVSSGCSISSEARETSRGTLSHTRVKLWPVFRAESTRDAETVHTEGELLFLISWDCERKIAESAAATARKAPRATAGESTSPDAGS